MTYIFHVVITPGSGSWRARCPALESHGAVTGGETKDEAPCFELPSMHLRINLLRLTGI